MDTEDDGDLSLPGRLMQYASLASVLLRRGVKCIFLTLGAQGAALMCSVNGPDSISPQVLAPTSCNQLEVTSSQADSVYVAHMKALPAKVVSLTGAGKDPVGRVAYARLVQTRRRLLHVGWPLPPYWFPADYKG